MSWANDNLASATAVSGSSGSITPVAYDGTTNPATSESGESLYGVGETLWWKWTAPTSGSSSFNTLGSPDSGGTVGGLDTTMQVFSGPSSSPTHAGLTYVGQNDDHGTGAAYTSNSRVAFTATSGTTYYIQVDQYATGQIGTLHLNWLAPAPPAPTASTWTDTVTRPVRTMYGGDDIVVAGTGLDTVTSTTIGGFSQTFTINSSTQLTIHVGNTARDGQVVVSNATGSASATNNGSTAALVRFAGPWKYPPDQSAVDQSNPSTQAAGYSSSSVASSQPDLAGAAYASAGGGYGLSATGGGVGGSTSVTWDLSGVVIALDERTTLSMPDYTPSAEIAADPTAVDYETLTSDTPVPTSDLTITFDAQTGGTLGKSTGQYNEDSNNRTLSEDLWQSNFEYRRLGASEWSFTGLVPKLASGAWPSRAHASSLPLDFSRSALNSGASLTVTSAGTWTNNRAALNDGAAVGPQGAMTVTWAAFGTARAWLVTLSPLIDGTAIATPVIDPSVGLQTGSNKSLNRTASVRGDWSYQPRRYRLIYTVPPAPATAGWTVGAIGW